MKLKTEFDFDAAHRLVGHKGKCNNLHGHIWKVIVELTAGNAELDDIGIMWDFGNVKKLRDMFDHKTILKDCEENNELYRCIVKTTQCPDSVYLMKENPTAENFCKEIANLIYLSFKGQIKITVYESPKSYAEYTK